MLMCCKKWIKENTVLDVNMLSQMDIIREQVNDMNPHCIWLLATNSQILDMLHEVYPKIKLIGWSGSAIASDVKWQKFDAIYSCAPETIQRMKSNGLPAHYVNNAFCEDILNFIADSQKNELVFIGQLIRHSEFHMERERLILKLLEYMDVAVYSPSYFIGNGEILKAVVKKIIDKVGVYDALYYFKNGNRLGNKNLRLPINMKLRHRLYPPVYGIDMFSVIANAKVVLNVHADSSSIYASNCRLFETTGVGACLLTDSKQRLNELFEDGKEIVTYSSPEDCVEKARWLLTNQQKAREIAFAGQRRCLREHTYENRVVEILPIIKDYIGRC